MALEGLARRSKCDIDTATHFAVDLNHDFGFLFTREFGIIGGPGVTEHRTCAAQLFPELLGQIGRERLQHESQLFHDLRRGGSGELFFMLHQDVH